MDQVISSDLLNSVRTQKRVTLRQVKSKAKDLFDSQLDYARRHALLEGNIDSSEPTFLLLDSLYYDGEIKEAEFKRAAHEIDVALTNLFYMDELKNELKSATLLMAQRSLAFTCSDVTVRAVPDVIAFFQDRPPLIVDWKVHSRGIDEAWLQLGVYAVALARCKPHKDFPHGFNALPEDIELREVQLLNNVIRKYKLTTDEVERIEEYVAETAAEIDLAVDGRIYPLLGEQDFPTTLSPAVCKTCPFREPCWKEIA